MAGFGYPSKMYIQSNSTNAINQTAKCSFCSQLLRLSSLPFEESNPDVEAGTLDELRASWCQDHDAIVEKFGKYAWTGHGIFGKVYLIKRKAERRVDLRVGSGFADSLVRLPDADGPWPGKILDPSWIREGLLNEWRRKCQSVHGGHCDAIAARETVLTGRPNLLVDTSRMCVARAQATDTYVALSYVWGGCDQLKTVKSNLGYLMKENSLESPEWVAKIPRTILDAMRLLETLGERYLWVDALCIIQDDEADKHAQINDMAAIYANASVTIVAAQGKDANSGLRGIKGITEPRDFQQQVFRLGDLYRFIYSPIVSHSSSNWSKRGWTFQESLLSQRKIVFCGERVQWQCLCAVWDEDIETDYAISPVHSRGLRLDGFEIELYGLLSSTWPDLHAYSKLVEKFSAKSLTYPEDVYSAFSGLTRALTSTFAGGFLFGIPEVFFDVGLLWKGASDIDRRSASSIEGESGLPSWSWMGWMGAIDGRSWNCGLHYIKRSDFMSIGYTSRRTVPLVQWHCGDRSNPRRRTITTYTSTEDIGANLDPGWTSHQHNTKRDAQVWSHWEFDDGGQGERHVTGFHDLREPDFYYTHESSPKDEFWSPIPICRRNSKPSFSTAMPFISCTTKRAFLRLGGRLGVGSSISIRTNLGDWAGCLEIHHKKQVILLDSGSEGFPTSGDTCELVAISGGFAYNDNYEYSMDEWNYRERPILGEKYEFYNVLWISWRDGVAYRNALGRVPKQVWNLEELETIDLVLG